MGNLRTSGLSRRRIGWAVVALVLVALGAFAWQAVTASRALLAARSDGELVQQRVRDGDFDGAVPDPRVVAEAWDAWRAEVGFATRLVAEAPSLDIAGDDPLNQHGSGGGRMSLREVLVGMIEEYARHMGHADLLRERIDGRLGQ